MTTKTTRRAVLTSMAATAMLGPATTVRGRGPTIIPKEAPMLNGNLAVQQLDSFPVSATPPDAEILELERKFFEVWARFDKLPDFKTSDEEDAFVNPLHDKAYELALRIMGMPARSVAGIAAKLRVADSYEGFCKDAADPDCTYIGPKLVGMALDDAERLAKA